MSFGASNALVPTRLRIWGSGVRISSGSPFPPKIQRLSVFTLRSPPYAESRSGYHTEKNIRNWGVVDRIFGVRGPGQRGCHIVDPQCSELVRHTIAVFNMATAHDSHDQRPARAALRVSDCPSHGAVPELLRADETFEPFRGCAGILASGRMLLEPLKQAVSIEGRGRRRITDALPLGDRHGCYALCSNPTIGRPINIECQHRQAMRAGEIEQRQIEFFGEAPDLRPI